MDIILWRHAEATDTSPDLERTLTDKGRRQAKATAKWLRKHLPNQFTVWASEATRSQQTAAFLHPTPRILHTLNPEINATTLPRLLHSIDANDTVVIVGHQPWLGDLSRFLMNGNWQGDAYWSYKKGGFVWFQVSTTAHGFQAKIKAALTPAILLHSPRTS